MTTVTDADRRRAAVTAAVAVADRFGMTPVQPLILRDSSHVSIRLAPFAVVARVISPVRTDDAVGHRLARELRVARHLVAAGAPIVAPAAEVPPGPHFHSGAALTLWKFVSHIQANESDAVIAAAALHAVHEALISYVGELPPFTEAVERCRSLQDGSSLPALIPTDRRFLLAHYERLRGMVDGGVKGIALHGDPHLGNVLMSSGGPLWTDLESACRGPLEWDLSCLPETALVSFSAVDHALLATLRDLRSVCVAVWCWNHLDRAPDKREAAEFHMQRLRERAAWSVG